MEFVLFESSTFQAESADGFTQDSFPGKGTLTYAHAA
jgi:hypothetical protein